MAGRGSGPGPQQEGRALVERLGGHWTANGGLCLCPAHEDRTPSLSIRAGRRRLLLHCFAGCAATDILRALDARGLLEPGAAAVAETGRSRRLPDLGEAARRIWKGGRSLPGTLAERYLSERGLGSTSPELRFNARTPHGRAPLTGFRPALIAAVRDDSGLVGIHRTFLDRLESGDPRAREKCGLGRFGSGAVRLGGAAPRLGLAEGIETALSATALFGVPCWATLGTERFARIALPAMVGELLLFLDHDAGGRRSEALARDFYRHLRIEAHYPSSPGEDWNDVLRRRGRAGG